MWRLIAPLMSGLANGSVKTAVKSTRNQAICYFLIGLSLFFAVIFLCVIAFIALSWIVSPILSATIIFAFWLIVALVVFFIGRIISTKRRKIYQQQMDDERFNLVAASLVAAVPAILKNKKTLALAVPLIGLAALMFWNKDKNSKS
ncbi:phage holin family protein [Bartonella sp. W8097]|uniref:phage holin family protein n=1 Tax=Bartonella apihabitans TaxID=2750929 RepID=UPI0018DC9B98|nr:phage holin family protein [Bartonella apihabitans]MBI0020595.1 phage holin family protein [Bartonella apihabitans]